LSIDAKGTVAAGVALGISAPAEIGFLAVYPHLFARTRLFPGISDASV